MQLRELMLEAGLARGTSQATMDNLAAKWLEMAAETLSPSTLRECRRLLEKIILPQFGTMKVRAIRPSDLDGFYAKLRRRGVSGRPLSGQSVHHVHALIRRLFNQGLKWGWIMVNPATNASPPRVNRPELEIPNVEVVTQIINFAEERNPDIACFLRLAAVTGARRGELCAIRWRDFDKSDYSATLNPYVLVPGQRITFIICLMLCRKRVRREHVPGDSVGTRFVGSDRPHRADETCGSAPAITGRLPVRRWVRCAARTRRHRAGGVRTQVGIHIN